MELVTLGIERLGDRLSQEYKQFQGAEDQVTELQSKLNSLKSFLKDADVKKHTSDRVRNCLEKTKEIVYDAEDIIETFILKEEVRKKSGIIRRIGRFASTIVDRRELVSNIEGISKRVSNVNQDMQSFGVQQNMISDGSRSSYPLQDRQREMRQEFATDSESNLVGLEENLKKLVDYLVEKDNIRIVSVTGMGGLGKTTLARQAFNHEMVKSKFDRFVWVCVSQEFTRVSIWRTILQNLTSKERKEEILNMEETDLHKELFQLLGTSKSLIVLDDIWKEEDWDLIKPIFPPEKDWKVLLTSRNDSVAVSNTTYNFKPECLTPEDSWELFQREIFQRRALPRNDASDIKIDGEMEEMAKQMIKHCGGLPLAVKVLGGMLAAKYTLHDWKRLSKDIGSHLVGEKTDLSYDKSSSVNYVLSLSIEEVPSYLKHCFLYLAHFPEYHKIDIEDLSYYWAAEGIFEPRPYDGETIRDVGDSYIEELVRRNMVISGRDVMTLRTCHLHDMMRDICLIKAKEENFLHIASNRPSTANSQPSFTCRRFVSHNADTLDVERDVNNPKLRSLVVVPVKYSWWKLSGSSFKRLELLRVLDLFRAECEGGKLPSGIGKLIHLRYFSLKWSYVSHLPDSLGNLLLLIYLNLNITESILVPNVLMGMHELRYLALPDSMNEKTKLELSNLVKLETLKNFSTKNSSIEDLRVMVRLRTLGINLSDETSIETLSASIGGLRQLEDLDITDHRRSKRNQEEGILLNFIHLKHLRLRMYMPKLPKEQHFPSHLTTLSLALCGLEENPMPILEKLLQLKEVTLDRESFIGRRMVCSGGGFPQLEMLVFYFLEEWEEWIVEEGSMPLLHTLNFWGCNKLKELPDGLRFITSLKELQIFRASLEFKEKLSEGGNDFYKVQHIPHLNIN